VAAVLKSCIPQVIDDVSNGTASLSYLKGGISSFSKKYPYVCCKFDDKQSLSGFEQLAFSWPSRISQHIYLGDWQAASNETVVRTLGIKYIVNCCKERNAFEDKEGFVYYNISIGDDPAEDISKYFVGVINFIKEATKKDEKILVHCHAGVSRSTTVVVAYLMVRKRWPLQKALHFVKKKRYIVEPNFGFLEQLCQFEQAQGLGISSQDTTSEA